MAASRTTVEQHRCRGCQHPSDDDMCARCRDTIDSLPTGFGLGVWVRLRGEPRVNVYRIVGFNRDGSLALYGGHYGTSSARTRLGARSVHVERCTITTAPVRD